MSPSVIEATASGLQNASTASMATVLVIRGDDCFGSQTPHPCINRPAEAQNFVGDVADYAHGESAATTPMVLWRLLAREVPIMML